MDYTLIANSGIQLHTFSLDINVQDKYKLWFRQCYDSENKLWRLDPVEEVRDTESDENYYYNKTDLYNNGFLCGNQQINIAALKQENIEPLCIGDVCKDGENQEIYPLTFSDRHNVFHSFENKWIPIPYLLRRTPKKFDFSPLNWARVKLEPKANGYNVILAFDTRTKYETQDEYKECPVFLDKFRDKLEFDLCDNEIFMMDFCSSLSNKNWEFVNDRLFKMANPDLDNISQIQKTGSFHMAYLASYIYLIMSLSRTSAFPHVVLYKEKEEVPRNVDMVVDIGNSRTSALLVENEESVADFSNVRFLQLSDFSNILRPGENANLVLNNHEEPFDMRLVFRKADFGLWGVPGSKQFVYPSLVRLGVEANYLIHQSTSYEDSNEEESLSTYSSPKRYLWDLSPNKEEWRFLVLEKESDDHILNVPGITNFLKSDGTLDTSGNGGHSFRYSRCSLMTLAFLEMLVQAHRQINSDAYRTAIGHKTMPRCIKRVIVTCPTAMSKIERKSLVNCANDAVSLFLNFSYDSFPNKSNGVPDIKVVPEASSNQDENGSWYYDEATCAQLVYMYGEVGYKYSGNCDEFFDLYGKKIPNDEQKSLTVCSLDIGAGTTDLMISKYSYQKDGVNTTITPSPMFYDSFYVAGDDMLKGVVKNYMLLSEQFSAFRQVLKDLSWPDYRQTMKNFFGEDYNGQTLQDRTLRKDFNLQYSVPLMHYFLSLLCSDSKDCEVHFEDVFSVCPPNPRVIEGFKKLTGIDVCRLVWSFNRNFLSQLVANELEDTLKQISTIIYSQACDIVLLSGRPASLPVIRDLFLKYYPVSPNRLIVLNNYYVGDWYPFDNNTGRVANPKTIVAMGGVVAHYASQTIKLNRFSINLDMLKTGLKSTANYISYKGTDLLTPDTKYKNFSMVEIPMGLEVRQLESASYPRRTLYVIEFNWKKIQSRVMLKNPDSSPQQSRSLVLDYIENLRMRLPFDVTLERDDEDRESLSITSIIDKNGQDVQVSDLDIHIQSLGVSSEKYWLDSGAFEF